MFASSAVVRMDCFFSPACIVVHLLVVDVGKCSFEADVLFLIVVVYPLAGCTDKSVKISIPDGASSIDEKVFLCEGAKQECFYFCGRS